MKLRLKRLIFLGASTAILFLVGYSFLTQIEHKELLRKTPLAADAKNLELSSAVKNVIEDITDDEDFSDNQMLSTKKGFKKLDCLINDEYSVACVKGVDSTVYLPFPFLRKYFGVTGKLGKRDDGSEYFSWQHSYSKVFYPREPYDYRGVFLWFDNYNVEVRDRVKYISTLHGVPVSSQWNADGHFYPIQIAQFGLSHFSKNLTLGKPRILKIEDGSFRQEHWNLLSSNNKDVQVETVEDQALHGEDNEVLQIEGHAIAFNLKKKKYNDLTLSFAIKPLTNVTITLTVQSLDSMKEYKIYYTSSDEDVTEKNGNIFYGFGSAQAWSVLTRDVGVDLFKALAMTTKKSSTKPRNLRLSRITFSGKLLLDDVTLSSSAHETHFRVAAKWLVQAQDENGGWPVQVTRKLSNGELILKPGWYSAMAQGQAISLLSRMYLDTQDSIYLETAIKALNLFYTNSTKNGIRTYFLDKFVWYEEYPTVPSSFVLNGFMYSLFGLYDLKMTCQRQECDRAASLYEEGVSSLKHLLTLFDTGSGSVYDLRHVSLGCAPNLARWDYHSTHINQLLYLNSIDSALILQTTAKRWVSYMKGKRAPHN